MLKTTVKVNSEYHFIRCIGEGLSSVVYLAFRSNTSGISDEKVAVKILKSQNSVAWLQNEFDSLKKVNSKNCVRVLGHESFDEGPALILEYIEGVTLQELGSRYQLNPCEIAYIEGEVLGGLTAISEAGLCHGDLSPKNILISPNGSIKLIDFGSFSDESALVGSPSYVSARRWRGSPHDISCDQQSWYLIREDLQSSFHYVPRTLEAAKQRANALENDFKPLVHQFDESAVQLIRAKMSEIFKEKELNAQTEVLSLNSQVQPSSFRRLFLKIASVSLLALVPAQELLSEPLKAATPASLLVRTREWTQVKVNGKDQGYSPVTLKNLPPGECRIEYKRPHASGELVLVLKPGQTRVLKDGDFTD